MNPKLILHIDTESPIDAQDFGRALISTQNLYSNYLRIENKGIKINKGEDRLLINSIENKCILAEFIPALGSLLSITESSLNVAIAMHNIINICTKIKMAFTDPDMTTEKREKSLATVSTHILHDVNNIMKAALAPGNKPCKMELTVKANGSYKLTLDTNEIEQVSKGLQKEENRRNIYSKKRPGTSTQGPETQVRL